MRAVVEVRPADPTDFHHIADLSIQAREESLVGAQLCAADNETIIRQLSVLSSLPGALLHVAESEGIILGFMLSRVIDLDLMRAQPSLYLEALYVPPANRRRGVGHSLISKAAEVALSTGAVDIYSQPLPGARGTQRFLSRLGFAPAAAHRVVSTTALVRSLSAEPATRRRATQALEDLIARRRRSRVQTHSGPLDLRAFQQDLERRTLETQDSETEQRRSANQAS